MMGLTGLTVLVSAFVAVSSGYKDNFYPAKVSVLQSRTEGDALRVDIRAETGNLNYQLHLKPAENIWAENSPIISINSDSKTLFRKEDISRSFRVYQDKESGAVLGIDGNKVSGILSKSHTIKSVGDDHYMFDTKVDNYLNDERIPPKYAKFIRQPPMEPLSRQLGPYVVEILAVVDSVLANQFTTDTDLYNYLTIFWNGVNARYGTITSASFAIKLAGAIIIRQTSDESFITGNIISGNQIKESTLQSFSYWIYEKYGLNSLPAYDVAYLMTGRDMVSSNGNTGLAGIAWLGAACPAVYPWSSYYATGMGEDIGAYYNGVHTATHEVAHNIGSPHDGSGDSASCSWNDGYIMSYISGTVNRLYFSSCSIAQMTNYASIADGACLSKIDNTNKDPNLGTSALLPGEVLDMEATCKKATGVSDSSAYDLGNCVELQCIVPFSATSYTIYTFPNPPPDRCPCKNNGVAGSCINGVCT